MDQHALPSLGSLVNIAHFQEDKPACPQQGLFNGQLDQAFVLGRVEGKLDCE
jgi:hypothetical protein